jgi:hypothetical protein
MVVPSAAGKKTRRTDAWIVPRSDHARAVQKLD